MEEKIKIKKAVKRSITLFIIVLILAIVGLVILRYNVEGEQNMPFNLSELTVISSAEGIKKEDSSENKWNVDVCQTNDIYLNIKKNKNYKNTEIIKSIVIKNITIKDHPLIGNIEIYTPKGEEKIYEYNEENKINDIIKYDGDTKSDINNFKISNQGGTIIFRIINKTGKTYSSNEDELKHDGTLVNKVGIENNEIKFKISFDLVINLESELSFIGNVELELPIGDITTNGVTNLNRNNIKDIVFKRE